MVQKSPPAKRGATSRPSKATKSSQKLPARTTPLRWSLVPHEDLGKSASATLEPGALRHAVRDSALFLAMRRMPLHDPAAMATYTQVACARLVEEIRALRDTYRAHLEDLGCRPVHEMYGVVFDYAVKDWAIRIFRQAVRRYIELAGIRIREWEEVFGALRAKRQLTDFELEYGVVGDWPELDSLIESRIVKACFEEEQQGGPFGKMASSFVGRKEDGETHADAAARIEDLWDKYSVWIEPLVSMFDVLWHELRYQGEVLSQEKHDPTHLQVALDVIGQVVNKHLVSLHLQDGRGPNLGEEGWLDLMRELDSNKVALEELPPTAKKLLTALRRKGVKIDSWEKAYLSSQPVSLEDANTRSLHNQIRTFVHNTAKRVRRLLAQSA